MENITINAFNATLDALLNSNPHARSKGNDFKVWCVENFNSGARISHIREQRQTTNRVSEQFRYFDPIVVFVCDDEVKRDTLIQYVSERLYQQLETVAIVGVSESTNNNGMPIKSYTYEHLLVYKHTAFSKWASEFFVEVEDVMTKKLSSVQASMTSYFLQQIFFGAPGTGKSHEIKKTTDTMPIENVFRTTFHPDSDYSTFVGCYKPTQVKKAVRNVAGDIVKADGREVFENTIQYEFVPQAFLKAYKRAYETDEPVVLVIEEINRGNCAQIFGDLFQLLDRKDGVSEYPIDADEDLRKYLIDTLGVDSPAIANGKLCLPSNLYIWATMNTSDQSLFPIDSAFKRRWEWKYIPINTRKENWAIAVNGINYSWSSFLENINEQIGETTNSEDKKLGFYFCKATDGTISADRFVSKVLFYIYNDVFKDYGFDKAFFKDNTKVMTFQSYYNEDGSINEQQVALFLENLNVEKAEAAPEGIVDDEPELSGTELSKMQQARKNFWQEFLTYANANNAEYRECFGGRKTPSTDKWFNFYLGLRKSHLIVEQTRSRNELMIGLYGERSKDDFYALEPHKQEIENELNIKFDWREMPTKKSTYIVEVTPNIAFDDASKQQEYFDFIIDRLLRMRTAFLKYLTK